MIINENSWHVKLHDRFYAHYSRPRSLCAYFWKIVWVCFVCSVIAGSMISGLTVAGAAIIEHLFVLSPLANYGLGFILGLIIVALIIAVAIGIVYGTMHFWAWYDLRKEEKEWERIKAKREGKEIKENIVIQYIKARKSKMCPVIHFEAKK